MGALLRALIALAKALRRAPVNRLKKVPKKTDVAKKSKETFPKKEPSAKQDCPKKTEPEKKGGPARQQTKQELEKSKRSYEKLIDEHKKKLEEYKSNPYAHDNRGVLKNAPPERHSDIIKGRIRELESQLRKQTAELKKIEERLRGAN